MTSLNARWHAPLKPSIAVIGGGLCGAVVLARLAQCLPLGTPVNVTLITAKSLLGACATCGPERDHARRIPEGLSAVRTGRTVARWLHRKPYGGLYVPRPVCGRFLLEQMGAMTRVVAEKGVLFKVQTERVCCTTMVKK